MTSANTCDYYIYHKDNLNVPVGKYYQHFYCHSRWYLLLQYKPAEDHILVAEWHDEEENWYKKDLGNLKEYIDKLKKNHSKDFTRKYAEEREEAMRNTFDKVKSLEKVQKEKEEIKKFLDKIFN